MNYSYGRHLPGLVRELLALTHPVALAPGAGVTYAIRAVFYRCRCVFQQAVLDQLVSSSFVSTHEQSLHLPISAMAIPIYGTILLRSLHQSSQARPVFSDLSYVGLGVRCDVPVLRGFFTEQAFICFGAVPRHHASIWLPGLRERPARSKPGQRHVANMPAITLPSRLALTELRI